MSNPLTAGQWYSVCIKKTRRSLSLTVGGTDTSIGYIAEDMQDSEFDLIPPGRCQIANLQDSANVLHGELADFVIFRHPGDESLSTNSSVATGRKEILGSAALPSSWAVSTCHERSGRADWRSSSGDVLFRFNPRCVPTILSPYALHLFTILPPYSHHTHINLSMLCWPRCVHNRTTVTLIGL